MADQHDEEQFFQKFYSDRENNRVIIENIKYALEELEMGTFDLTVSFLLIKDANAGSSRCFTDANIEVENIIEESSGMPLLLPTASLFLDGYSVLQTFLESLKTEMTPAMPGDVMERQALRELLQFILSDHSILADNRGKKERESTLAVRLAQHLMVPLVPQKTYVIDSYPHLELQQCCRIDHPINGKKGDTSFGIAEGWHGKVDILLMDKEVPCCVEESTKDFEVSSEYSNSSVEVKSNDKFTANNLEQLMAQTVVFSFLQYKENGGKLKTSLVPGIGICSDKLIIHLYDSEEDVLLETHPIDLFEEDKAKLNLQAILVLWMTLNYRLFCSGIPEAFKKYKAKFHEILTPAQLEKYRSSVKSPLHVSGEREMYVPLWSKKRPIMRLKNMLLPPKKMIKLGDIK